MLSTMKDPEKIEATLVHKTVRQGKKRISKNMQHNNPWCFCSFCFRCQDIILSGSIQYTGTHVSCIGCKWTYTHTCNRQNHVFCCSPSCCWKNRPDNRKHILQKRSSHKSRYRCSQQCQYHNGTVRKFVSVKCCNNSQDSSNGKSYCKGNSANLCRYWGKRSSYLSYRSPRITKG